jgi:hypothetical protein
MIRLTSIIWVSLAGAIGLGLYHLKQEVQALEDELFRLNRNILTEQEAIHVLRAEWSYINQPSRLQSLAARHLDLQPTKPAQLGTLATLPPLPASPAAPMVAETPPPKVTVTSVVPVNPATQRPVQNTAQPAAHRPVPRPESR